MVMSLKNVSLNRNGKRVLQSISGELKAGKVIALLGPNGAGKSTLIQAMAGLLEYDGDIFIDNINAKELGHEGLAKKLAYLPQQSQLQFPLEVKEVLSLATIPFSLTKLEQQKQVKNLIKEWNIESLAHKDFRQLSGGEQQRCQIARTYLQLTNIANSIGHSKTNPDTSKGIWLLDEPASSLDLEHQKQLEHACLNAAKEGHCVVVILHDLNQAVGLTDDVWLLKNGELVAQGPIKETMTEALIKQVFNVSARRIEDSGESFFIFN